MEGIYDSPYRSEQSDEWCDRASNRQPRKISFKASHLLRRSDLHGALHGQRIPQSTRSTDLPLILTKAGLKHAHDRAGAELLANGCNVLQPLRAPECPQKAATLYSSALQHS